MPDSLIREFHTAGGRKVYDGGGVMPDIRQDGEYSSTYAYIAYTNGHIDEFIEGWMLENREREVTPREFSLTDADYADFVRFMGTKRLDYEPLTAESLETLRQSAEVERLMTDEMKAHIDGIAGLLSDSNASGAELYRDELERIIEEGIVLRRHYASGVAEHELTSDKSVARAVETLHDPALYREILTERDTEKR